MNQGFQHQHSSWRDLINSIGGVQSMSRKGDWYNNEHIQIRLKGLTPMQYRSQALKPLTA
ncbi:Integrase core domain [Corynebacterium epidermidicanis]|uniref:Integrase core domain n=1 Tax=Corynebacterium epidermidicanis TaxID=1050174 RepID=A0A0G3GSM2_9CORY|nr:Integrase core domain [Corynebacterium epidermidicanis]